MKVRPDLNELAKEVFKINKAKGYHDEDYSNETFLMLVVTELSEAVEAHRKGKKAHIESFDFGINDVGADFIEAFEHCIKDTIEDELADTVIRLLDLAGLREYTIQGFLLEPVFTIDRTFPENIFRITTEIVYYKWSIQERICFAIFNIESFCKQLSIDLWMHVNLKLLYNQAKPKNKKY